MPFFIDHQVFGAPLDLDHFLNGRGAQCDSGQVLAAKTQLKSVEAGMYEKPFPPLKSIRFIPRKFDAGAWATHTSHITIEGEAKMKPIGGMAEDIEEALGGIDEHVSPVREFGVAYGFGRKEMIHAAKLGIPLDGTKARWCMQAYETLVDELAARGDVKLGLLGVLSNKDIPRESSKVIIGPGTDNAVILALLNEIAGRIPDRTNEVGSGSVMIMPLKQRDYIANTPFNTGGDARSILEVFLQNNEYVQRVESWSRFKHAGNEVKGQKANHIIGCWTPDANIVRQQIPEPFTTLDPQMQGTRTIVNCVASIGSVETIRPKEMQLYEVPSGESA